MDERLIFEVVVWVLGGVCSAIGAWFALKGQAEKALEAARVADHKAHKAHERIDALETLITGRDGLYTLAERIKGLDEYARETRLKGLHDLRDELGRRVARLEEWKDDGGHGA
jgi:hypothetical protein